MSEEFSLPFVASEQIESVVSYGEAVDALERALLAGGATAHTPLRTHTTLPEGHLLYMPSKVGDVVGVKLASVSPGNTQLGLPRIQGLMVLSDSRTLQPRVILDAAGLTVLRTSAVSALAVRHLAPNDASRLVVFGAGPQAWGHVQAIRAVRPLSSVVVVGRSPAPAQDLVDRISDSGLHAERGTSEAVSEADIVACCTSASTPLFDSAQLPAGATVVAMGSHSPVQREVDTSLVRRGMVVVETRTSAFAEAGDIILACQDGVPEEEAVNAEIEDIVRKPIAPTTSPKLFKGVGEAWSDVAIAAHAAQQLNLLNLNLTMH